MSAERNISKATSNLRDNNKEQLNKNDNSNNQQQSNTMPASVSSNYPYGISFSSNMAFANESDDIAYIEKRTAHNALERQRREGLNSKFQELAHVLPALQQVRRPSKSMIVAKSLEFVSNARERESDFQGQLHALRKENEQLMRQAMISKKRMKRRLEQEKSTQKSSKKPQPSSRETDNSESKPSSGSSTPMATKLRKRSSKLKPQTRQPSIPTSEEFLLSCNTEKPKDDPVPESSKDATSSTVSSKPNKKRPVDVRDELDVSPPKQLSQKRNRNDSNEINAAHSSVTAIPDAITSPSPHQSNSKRRKRNATTESYHPPPAIASATDYAYYNNSDYSSSVSQRHYAQDQYHQQQQHAYTHHHYRYNNHQPTSRMHHHHHQQQEIISPVVSRNNSLTIADQIPLNYNHTNINENLVVPSQFDIVAAAPSPFGNERIFYSTFENFDQPVVSSIPAVRTPVGDRNSLIHTPSPAAVNTQPPHYDATLDILNSIIQDQSSSDSQYYDWH